MSSISISDRSALTSASTQRPPNILRRYFEAFYARSIRNNLRARLDELSDLELKDIGITRAEIDYVVRADPSIDPRGF
ncbi:MULTISPECIES: DUF1127 domain-containing protein [unclassified Bradyrhizobium]